MFYRLFIGYLRVRLIRLILNRVMVKGKGVKTISGETSLIGSVNSSNSGRRAAIYSRHPEMLSNTWIYC
jgi:hypothetical protein